MGVSVTMDEADKKKLDPSRKYDPYQVHNKKPGFRYRMLNKNDRNIERRQHEGFELVQGDDPERLGLNESTPLKKGADTDSTRRFSDLILARIPEERIVEKENANRALIEHRTRSVRNEFIDGVGDRVIEEAGGNTRYAGSMDEQEYNEQEAKANKGKGK